MKTEPCVLAHERLDARIPNVASFRCSRGAILVQVLTRLARAIAIAARSRLQQIINPADISLLQWGSVLVKRLF